jgi:hypothetical protein
MPVADVAVASGTCLSAIEAPRVVHRAAANLAPFRDVRVSIRSTQTLVPTRPSIIQMPVGQRACILGHNGWRTVGDNAPDDDADLCLRKSRARDVIRHACGTTTLSGSPSTRVLLASDASLAELEHAFAQQQHDANPYGLAGFTGSSKHSPGRNEEHCVSKQYFRRRSVRGSDSPSKPHLCRPTAPAAGLSTSLQRRARKRARPVCTEDFSRETEVGPACCSGSYEA